MFIYKKLKKTTKALPKVGASKRGHKEKNQALNVKGEKNAQLTPINPLLRTGALWA